MCPHARVTASGCRSFFVRLCFTEGGRKNRGGLLGQAEVGVDFTVLRRRMVDNQIRTRDVTDHNILSAFLEMPREQFVEASEQPFAYSDRPLSMLRAVGGRQMMVPFQLARLLQLLQLGPDAKVMVIGCGTGYSAAILSRLVSRVVAVEENEALLERAGDALRDVGAANVQLVHNALIEGYPDGAPYDGILIDGAVETLPPALIQQLRPDGQLVAIEQGEGVSRAVLHERIGDEESRWPGFEAWATLLPGFERKRAFVF